MRAVFYYDGKWYDQEPKMIGPMTPGFWFGSAVFDGSRAFGGLAPDLDLHCARIIQSAKKLNMNPPVTAEEVIALCVEGIRKLPREGVYYVRPMMFPTRGAMVHDPDSTGFLIAVHERPFPDAPGFSACKSDFRRPDPDMAPNDAKASCLYPNSGRALVDAARRGFANAIVTDSHGNVAEFANSNLWIAKDGVVKTPAINGTFLNGITRQRVMALLRGAGFTVEETTLVHDDVLGADEVFSSGNMAKVFPCIRVDDREFQPGPVYLKARELYFEYAKEHSVF